MRNTKRNAWKALGGETPAGRFVPFLGLTALLALLLASPASARPSYVSVWSGTYPGSSSLSNAAAAGNTCQLCHFNSFGGQPWNAYGWAIRMDFLAGNPIGTAILNVEAGNADGDPDGLTNLFEISADAQPGWTVGANNTQFFSTGATVTGNAAPAGILGNLDPPAPPPVPMSGPAGRVLFGFVTMIAGALVAGRRARRA